MSANINGLIGMVYTLVLMVTLALLATQIADEILYRRHRALRREFAHHLAVQRYRRTPAAEKAIRTPTGPLPVVSALSYGRPTTAPPLPPPLAVTVGRLSPLWPPRPLRWAPTWEQPALLAVERVRGVVTFGDVTTVEVA